MTSTADSSTEPPWIHIGSHALRFEPPDIIYFRIEGDVSVADMREQLRQMLQWPRPEGGFFYLVDVALMKHKTQKSNEVMKDLPPDFIRSAITIGANFSHRVGVDFILRTARLLRLKLPSYTLDFASNEAEARAIVDKKRKGLA